MNLLKDLQKKFDMHNLLILVGVVALYVAYSNYSGRKGSQLDGLSKVNHQEDPATQNYSSGTGVTGVTGDYFDNANNQPAEVSGIQTPAFGMGGCVPQKPANPADLLPRSNDSQIGGVNMGNMNLLSAGALAGINTVGSSLRNANLQVRSEPPNPQSNVSPWMNSTIDPDLTRLPLEIGCGSQ